MDMKDALTFPQRIATRGFDEIRDVERQLKATLLMARNAVDAFAPVLDRAKDIGDVIDRLGPAMDDIAQLRVAAMRMADSAEIIARDAETIALALPNIERLTDIAHPIDNAVDRLGRLADRMPGSKRTPVDE